MLAVSALLGKPVTFADGRRVDHDLVRYSRHCGLGDIRLGTPLVRRRLLDYRHKAQVDTMRDAITAELNQYESESRRLLEQRTTLQAAELSARIAMPSKSTLG